MWRNALEHLRWSTPQESQLWLSRRLWVAGQAQPSKHSLIRMHRDVSVSTSCGLMLSPKDTGPLEQSRNEASHIHHGPPLYAKYELQLPAPHWDSRRSGELCWGLLHPLPAPSFPGALCSPGWINQQLRFIWLCVCAGVVFPYQTMPHLNNENTLYYYVSPSTPSPSPWTIKGKINDYYSRWESCLSTRKDLWPRNGPRKQLFLSHKCMLASPKVGIFQRVGNEGVQGSGIS